MSNTLSPSDLLEAVSEMDMDDLNELIDIVKVRRDHLIRNKANKFLVGDRVRAHNLRKRNEWAGVHEGTITKINRKTADVTFPHPISGRDHRWKVYLHNLEKVED